MIAVNLIGAIGFLRTAEDMKEALNFLKTIQQAKTQQDINETLVANHDLMDLAS